MSERPVHAHMSESSDCKPRVRDLKCTSRRAVAISKVASTMTKRSHDFSLKYAVAELSWYCGLKANDIARALALPRTTVVDWTNQAAAILLSAQPPKTGRPPAPAFGDITEDVRTWVDEFLQKKGEMPSIADLVKFIKSKEWHKHVTSGVLNKRAERFLRRQRSQEEQLQLDTSIVNEIVFRVLGIFVSSEEEVETVFGD